MQCHVVRFCKYKLHDVYERRPFWNSHMLAPFHLKYSVTATCSLHSPWNTLSGQHASCTTRGNTATAMRLVCVYCLPRAGLLIRFLNVNNSSHRLKKNHVSQVHMCDTKPNYNTVFHCHSMCCCRVPKIMADMITSPNFTNNLSLDFEKI